MNDNSTTEAFGERLRELHRQASDTKPGRQPETQHLENNDLELASLGGDSWSRLDDRHRGDIVDHLASCDQCAAIVRELRSLKPWAEDVQHARQIGRFRRPRRLIMPLAAALAVSMLGLLLWNAPPPASQDVVRGATSSVLTPSDDATLDRVPTELTWPAQAGASGYRVELLDQQARPIWRSDALTEPRLELDEATRAQLQPGAAYAWTVEIDGSTARTQLGPHWFTIAR